MFNKVKLFVKVSKRASELLIIPVLEHIGSIPLPPVGVHLDSEATEDSYSHFGFVLGVGFM
jgi:hypothetical protein